MNMRTTRVKKALRGGLSVGLAAVLAVLMAWAWRAHFSERFVQAQVRRAVQLEAQAGGTYAAMALSRFSVPAWFPANLR